MEESLHTHQPARLRSMCYECTFPFGVNFDVIPVIVRYSLPFAMYIPLSFTVCYELDIRPGDAEMT
jgi:hypothetical protein